MELLEGPTASQMEAIRYEVGEDSDRMQHNLQLLQKWISCQAHLPQDYDNHMLELFLRGCKHNLERTKQKLEMFFIARAKMPEVLCNREPTADLMEKHTKLIKIAVLPKLTPTGHRVSIMKVMPIDNDEWELKDILKYIFMIADVRVVEETPIAGDIFVYDLQNVKISVVFKYATPLLKKALYAAHQAYPQRLQRVHLVNCPPFVDKMVSITKSFMKEKMRNRFIMHETADGLLNYIPRDILPEEYAGTAGKYEEIVSSWTACLIKRKKWFQQQDNVKAMGPFVESKNSFNMQFDDHIGIQGSFRKLEID